MSFVVTFLVASVLTPTNNTNADDNTSSSASADGYTMTLSATSAVNLALSVSDDDTMTVGQGTVSVQTTSPGYRLYISMTGDTTGLSGIADGISGNIPATSGSLTSPISLTRGTWGYAIPSSGVAHLVTPNGFSSTYEEMSSTTPDTSKLFAVPPTSSSNPQMIASSTSSTSGDNYPIYYAVRANSATAPGSYTNNVLFTATADAAASRALTLTPSTIDANTATTVTVATTLYSTADYLEATVTLGNTTLICSRTSNAPLSFSCPIPATTKGTYTVTVSIPKYSETYTSTLTVEDPAPTYFFDLKTMQQMAEYPSLCSTATTPAASATALDTDGSHAGNTSYVPTVELEDTRDNTVYTVSKLPDGNCWMTENLKLGKSTDMTLTSADSDVASDFVLPAVQTSGNNAWSDASNSTNTKHVYATGNDTYGNYYNWYAATAGTGTSDMKSTSVINLTNASSSICPKGWRLPDGGQSTSKSFFMLDKALGYSGADRTNGTGLSTYTSVPLQFPYAGYYYYNSGSTYQGSRGFWWTRSAGTTAGEPYIFDLSTYGLVRPQNYDHAGNGSTIRCVARGDFWDITDMQEMTATLASSVQTPGASATTTVTTRAAYNAASDKTAIVPQRTLYDIRDGNSYTVRKLADGNVWMTQNLRIINKPIDGINSNLPIGKSITIPASASSGWCTAYTSACIDKLIAFNTNNADYGVYYNWYTATGTYGKYATLAEETTYSICPKGWRLPVGGDSGEFQGLYNEYNTPTLMLGANGPAFKLSGYRENTTNGDQNIRGYYWASTGYDNNDSRYVGIDTSNVLTTYYQHKWYGSTVRCIAE